MASAARGRVDAGTRARRARPSTTAAHGRSEQNARHRAETGRRARTFVDKERHASQGDLANVRSHSADGRLTRKYYITNTDSRSNANQLAVMRSSRETRSHVQGETRRRTQNLKLIKPARRTLAVSPRDARRMRNRHGVRAGCGARGPVPKQPWRENMHRTFAAAKTQPTVSPEKDSKFGRALTTQRHKRDAQEYACERADLQHARKSGDAQRRVCRAITADIAGLRQ